MPKLSTILDQIDDGTILLPEFQRGYVWNRDQVRGLMRSLYLGYPVGSLLVWQTEADPGSVRGSGPASAGVRLLLLDGQQRITSLYGVVRGKPPAFFEGNADAFRGLRFNIETETFEFYAPAKMRDDPRWIDVTALFTEGLASQLSGLLEQGLPTHETTVRMERLSSLHGLLDREFHQEKITGRDKSVDVVVDIFNKVNSGGTKLSKGDLALAKICADWSDARQVMRSQLAEWSAAGYGFSLEWLLRNATAVATGRSQFSTLDDVPVLAFEEALTAASQHVDSLLNTVSARLGLDHDRVLVGRYAFPVMTRFLHLTGGHFPDASTRDRLLYWYVNAAIRGRFSGSTESVLNKDFDTLESQGVDGLIDSLREWRGGNLGVSASDFSSYSLGSRFYPLLYLLTRVSEARNFCDGLPLHAYLLGKGTSLQVHHVFPKALLYKHGYSQSEVNQVGNFCFLTATCNNSIGASSPEQYFSKTETQYPGALASQWVPMDESLWRIDRYLDFLAARRELLAATANVFLGELEDGGRVSTPDVQRVTVHEEDRDDARIDQIRAIRVLAADLGLASPATEVEIADPVDGRVLCIAEAYWPDGLQTGQGQPVVLELDPEEGDLGRMQELGFEVFTTTDALTRFLQRRSAEMAGVGQ